MRFILFLPVAARQCFLEIARPSRASPVSFSRLRTVNHLSLLRLALSNTRPYALASSSRLLRRSCWDGRFCLSASWFAVVGPPPGERVPLLRSKLGAALRAAPLENEAAGFRSHTGTKPVGACALDLARLIRTFHCLVPGDLSAFCGPRTRRAARVRRWFARVNRRGSRYGPPANSGLWRRKPRRYRLAGPAKPHRKTATGDAFARGDDALDSLYP